MTFLFEANEPSSIASREELHFEMVLSTDNRNDLKEGSYGFSQTISIYSDQRLHKSLFISKNIRRLYKKTRKDYSVMKYTVS